MLALFVFTSLATAGGMQDAPQVELVESAPVETTLDHADIRNASDVWVEMIDASKTELEFAEFYASDHPGSRLEPVIAAVEKAADRGVHVRFLAEQKFYATYPQVLDRLAARKGIEVRRYDMSKLSGGVLHAKYFIVDARECYVGSQNFDWRSLEHIQELGLRVRSAEVVRAVQDVFDADWSLAGGGTREASLHAPRTPYSFPQTIGDGDRRLTITPVFSPKSLLIDETLWELPRLVDWIDSAQHTVRVQVLTYKPIAREEGYFAELETALRRAAARGVHVELLVADWSKRKGTIEFLQSLEPLPNIEVKLVTIPQWSGGYVSYARVVHAKYMSTDGARAWIGTSNWERDYFFASRSVGFILEGEEIATRLEHFFDDTWSSPYATEVDPCAVYVAPKSGD